MIEVTHKRALQSAAVFWSGAVWTALVSVALFISLVVRPSADVNALNMATIIGAPAAYWMMANPYDLKWLRWLAPLVFIAAVGPAIFGWIIFLYLPGLPGVITGLRWR